MEVNQIASYLGSLPFFTEVSENSLRQLCSKSELESYDGFDPIFQKGDEGDGMYVIIEGKVRVHDRDHIYDYLDSGDCFGEYSMIDNQKRSASITAEEPTRVLKISQENFLNLMAQDTGFAQGILSVMIKRHRELDNIQERLATSNKQIELANSKLKGLIDGAMDTIFLFDDKFRILLANSSAHGLLENEDVLQRNLLLFFDDDSADYLQQLIGSDTSQDRFPRHQYLSRPVTLIGSLGRRSINEGTLSLYSDGAKQFYILILRNIEDRLQAQSTIDLLASQTAYLEEEIENLTNQYGILAEDPGMITVLNHISQVAPTAATVMIHGETGTGKELVARAIHEASDRKEKPLIRIHCGAIQANLIESELFGHEKGAFTGAIASRKGRFLLADKGTLFLDEIGELPLDLQPKLLRVIQEGEFEPLGSSETQKVDVRIIAATHRDLLEQVRLGNFREDLYYRLNVYPIEVPPLRERGTDVCLIAQEMLQQFAREMNKKPYRLKEADKRRLISYDWPGNVRELENLLERAMIVSSSGKVDLKSVLPAPKGKARTQSGLSEERIYSASEWTELEKANILKALKKSAWKISGKDGAAALLNLPPTTLASKIKALGLSRPV